MKEKVIENKIKTTLGVMIRAGHPIWFFKHAANAAMKVGIPDIVACIKGMFIGIEVKRPNGKQSDAQCICEQNIKNAGGKYWLVDDHNDFIRRLNNILGSEL